MSIPTVVSDASTLVWNEDSLEARYRRCKLQEMVQHIDIWSKPRLGHGARGVRRLSSIQHEMMAQSGISMSPTSSVDKAAADIAERKLSKCSVLTRTSCLYPGHDRLSRRERNSRMLAERKEKPQEVVTAVCSNS